MIMHYIYVLFSKKDRLLYIGYATDLTRRVKRHKAGYVRATKNRLPMELIYYEAYATRLDAKRREKYLKGGKGRSELKIQLKEILSQLKYKCL